MSGVCRICGSTKSQASVDARTLGLEQEFQRGIYTCCEIVEWADEQCLAWFEATHEDDKRLHPHDGTRGAELSEEQAVFVHVRVRRAEVPWYRAPEELS